VGVVSLPTYANHASNRAVEQPRQENVKVATDTTETKTKRKQEQKKKTTQKQQQKVAARTTTKPQVYQPPKPEQKPVYQKPTVKKTYEKPKQKPSIQHVSVSLARSGGSVVATIGTSKSGTCYFTFKDLSDKYSPRYKNVSASASNGRLYSRDGSVQSS
jgi:outer membrane biosynthesis protein TonB